LYIEKKKIIGMSEAGNSTSKNPLTTLFIGTLLESEEWTLRETLKDVVKKYEEAE
jgi:hypothetical protein